MPSSKSAKTKKRATTKRRPMSAATKKKRCVKRKIRKSMHEFKKGKLRFAKSKANPKGIKVKSRPQAIAIAISTANRKCSKRARKKK